jgi:endonuclease/exonuclease/phosphatase (EEP) superfamily protein YafD
LTNPPSTASRWPRSGEFSLAVWNTQKGQGDAWRIDFETLTDQHDFVLLQEFANTADWTNVRYWSFAPGFRTGSTPTGVATLSQRQPAVRCEFTNPEPWLRSPKATNITQYALEPGTSLVLVNLHAINFSFGLAEFSSQISEAVAAVATHDGPLVFTGDFNTWRAGRTQVMHEMLSNLGLEAVQFTDDQRTRFLGSHLDHVYVRGLQVIDATTRPVSTSDHNPMLVKLSV